MAALTGQLAGDALIAKIGAILLEQTALSTTTYPTLATVTEALNAVQRRLLTQHPWLLVLDETTATCTANNKSVTLADGIERVVGIQIQGSQQSLRYVPRNRLMLEYPGGWTSIGAGTPDTWTDAGLATNNALKIDLFPTPSEAFTLTIQYQKRPAAITNSGTSYSTIPPEYEEALVFGTAADMLEMLSDNRAQIYKMKYMEVLAKMWMRDEQNLDGVYGAMIDAGPSTAALWRPYSEV